MTTVSVVGSTGSIGTQTLDVIRTDPDRFRVEALGAARSVQALGAQAVEFRPDVVAIADEALAPELKGLVPAGVEVRAGQEALPSIAGAADVVVNGVVGFAGLGVTLAALRAGRRLALANKESLIAGGPAVRRVRATPGAELLPVDSEHCAIHQCLRAGGVGEVRRLILTASGGPFRGRARDELGKVTVEEALAHPTWHMGPKISVDSSTLMNKGLEVIEANELFGAPVPGSAVTFDRIEVVVHPQSIVHSMVEFSDGATIAQLSHPDMCLPIGYALCYPERLGTAFGAIDWSTLSALTFERPDREAFPCLDLAYQAGRLGGTAPAWLSAANEVAVEAFLARRVSWLAIADVIAETLSRWDATDATSAEEVIDADRVARVLAGETIERMARAS
ncbi:MAG TPA: 1-deoxy-D-xylulose-5-phosphate reductoisomerase [Acidimicrobiales bacterium]|nr:1-deoxy-D-xylulose-5-phosphate reductoisomerase [Acidimicrobiales bacterium]